MDTPTRKRHTAEETHWKTSDDFLGDDENLHDQLPSVEEIRMSAASAGRVSSSSSSKASCRPVMMICRGGSGHLCSRYRSFRWIDW